MAGRGLAQFYQNTDIQDKDVLLGQPSGNTLLFLREQRIIPLATLFDVGHDSPYYHEDDKGSVFYAESWALTHFLEISDFEQKTHRLSDYARLLAAGTEPLLAARQAFGELPALQKSLEEYIQHSDYKQFRVKTIVTVDEAGFQSVPIPDGDLSATSADVMAGNGRMDEAKTLLAAVLTANPKNTLALEAMGSMAMRNNDRAAAAHYYGAAVADGSDSLMANYNFAISALMANDRSQNGQVEASLRKSIQLDATFAPGYDALCHFLAQEKKSLDEAHMLCLKAIQAEPTNVHYRMDSAYVETQRENYSNALNILRSAVPVAKTLQEQMLVQGNVTNVEQMQEMSQRREARHVYATTEDFSGTRVETESKIELKTVHYAAPATGAAKRLVRGVIRSVKCSYPTMLTINVEHEGKLTKLYAENYYKLPFSTLGFLQTKALDPCGQLEGMKANISFLPVTDAQVAGEMVAVELTK